MLDANAAQEMAEKIDLGEPCPSCCAEWKPTEAGKRSMEMWHKDGCEYIAFYESEEKEALKEWDDPRR